MSLRRVSGIGRVMSKSVCIIGAGPSGLVAAKTLLHNAPKDEFRVTVYDAQHDIGGLWPVSKEDTGRQVHPLMVANQSRHTVHFSDMAWEEGEAPQFPVGWQVGQYLKRYADRYLTGRADFELKLKTKVVRANPDGKGWDVSSTSEEEGEKTSRFDYLLVATGFFGEPIIPKYLLRPANVPMIHSSAYRDLQGLLGKGRPGGGKILIVGGQMSGVEIAGTIGAHLSAAANSPEPSDIQDVDKYTIHHVVQRPVWVFPLFTSPEPTAAAAPFLPLDCPSYNLNNRPQPLADIQGHIPEGTAKAMNTIFQTVLGNDQSVYSEHLHFTDREKTMQPYMAVSDWYVDLVRSGLITLSRGKVVSLVETSQGTGTAAVLSPFAEHVYDVAAVVFATGFDASPCLDFLPEAVLEKLHHSREHLEQPVALAFHGTHHPEVPNLGFVGFYRSPYWGVMQMQARFLSRFWSESKDSLVSPTFEKKLEEDVSIERTQKLRGDPRLSQFPMGDYPFLMQEMAEALGLPREEPLITNLPNLSHNGKPINMLTPARYPDQTDDEQAKEDARRMREDTHKTILAGLTTPKFVARAVFRSLLGTWRLERDLVSKLPTHPSGHFSGTAKFLLRNKTTEGLQCTTDGETTSSSSSSSGWEYLYIEEGEFKTDTGFGFRATRRYVWRYDDDSDTLSVWFVKPDDEKRVDYLFHEIEFEQPPLEADGRSNGWNAKSGHLCVEDFYDVSYNFKFAAVNLKDWTVGYTVRGPKKDYTIRGNYTRE